MDPLRDELQGALAQTYRIDRELGGGGMSRVFLATETALDRRVVLKVLPPELVGSVSVDRFKREILLAARLQHAHIVPLLATGDANGLPWFAMPFVDGESLRTRLGAGELPIADVVRTLRDVAAALAYAHSKGVVHRDIKPENILLSEGSAVVTDFGVAKALLDAGGEHGATLTGVGVALGTPAYMAPEQIAGDARTDHRADVYALGIVAYEMLTGHNPFAGRSTQATMAAHMMEQAAPVERVRPATPAALAQLVQRSMAKSAADRPQTAQEFVHALDALATPTGSMPLSTASHVAYPEPRSSTARNAAIAVAVTVFVALGVYGMTRLRDRGPALSARRVAVIPFENLTGDPSLAVVGRVASEELSRSIAQTDSADVVAGSAVMAAVGDGAQGTTGLAERVAKATGAGIVVLGSYSKVGDSLRVQVSLVDARTGKVMRALDPTTGPIADPMIAIGALRERLLGSIVSGDLARKVTVASTPPKYSAYLELFAGVREFVKDQAASRPYFERAIAIDSTFVAAYHFLATTYMNADMYDQAERVVEQLNAQRSHLSALDRQRADYLVVRLRGNAQEALNLGQELYQRTGDPQQAYLVGYLALGVLKPALALDALMASDSLMVSMGWVGQIRDEAMAYHQLADYQRELATLNRGIQRLPAFGRTYTAMKLRAYAGLHDLPAARALTDTLLSKESDRGTTTGLLSVIAGASEFDAHGDSAGAQQLNRMAIDWAGSNAPSTSSTTWHRTVGRLWFFAGELDSAAAHLSHALPDTSVNEIASVSYLAMIAARKRDVARARAVSDSLAANLRKWDRGRTAYYRAAILAELGDREQAMRLLALATKQGQFMSFWHRDPMLRSLRGYPPFDALIKPDRENAK